MDKVVIIVVIAIAVFFASSFFLDGSGESIDLVSNPKGELTVYFLDVGQGDSILIDRGETEILIDTGPESADVVDLIRDLVDGELEALVTTHPDADHIGNSAEVLAEFEVEKLIHDGSTKTTNLFEDYWDFVEEEDGLSIKEPKRDSSFSIDGLDFYVLNPEEENTGNYNDNSVVLLLTYGEVTFYLTGDAEEDSEQEMVDYFDLPKAYCLKAGHHGSSTASTLKFLAEIEPEVVIYSAGEGNSYGHPHAETISRWIATGAEYYGTDVYGTIAISTDGTLLNTEVIVSN